MSDLAPAAPAAAIEAAPEPGGRPSGCRLVGEAVEAGARIEHEGEEPDEEVSEEVERGV